MSDLHAVAPQPFKRNGVYRAIAIALTATLAPMALQAETRLPRIDVIGSGEITESKVAGSAVVIDREVLEETQPLSTQDALKRVAGVTVCEEEGYGFIPNIGIRGLNPNRSQKVLVLEDGAPIAPGLFTASQSYYSPRIERMERIEVLKGAASLRYGPSTIGGTVNYITRDPIDGNSLTLKGGSHGYQSILLESGRASNDAFGGASLLRSEGDGGRDNGFEMTDAMIKGGFAFGDNQLVSAKFSYYDNEINTSYVGLRPNEYRDDHTQNPAPNDWFITHRVAFDVNHEMDVSDNVSLNTLLYWNRLQRDYWRQDVVGRDADGTTFRACDGVQTCTGGRLREFEMLGIDSRLNMTWSLLGMNNAAEFGVRLHTESMDNRRVNGFTEAARSGVLAAHDEQFADSVALYVQNRFDVTDRIAVTPGVRMERYEQRRENHSPTDPEGYSTGRTRNSEVMPGLGMTWQATAGTQLYAGAYKGFAPAGVATAISADGIDQALEAERSTNVEIGVRGKGERLSYEVTAFQMDFDNQITPQTESGGITVTNAGETLTRGVELNVGAGLGGGFTLDSNVTWLPVAEYRSTSSNNAFVAGNRLVYAPELAANLALNYRRGALRTGVSANHVSSQYSDAANTKEESADGRVGEIPEYTVYDVYGSVQLTPATRLFGTVRNVTDEKYIAGRHPDGIFPGMERNFQVGVTVDF